MGTYSLDYGDKDLGGKLTSFIDRDVNPDANYLDKCGECTNMIVSFMHEVTPYSIASTIKGGSFGKGTAVKGKSDLDILFVVNDIKSIEDLMKKLKQIKHELHNALCCGSFSSVDGPLSKEKKAQRRHLKKNKPFKVSNIRRTPFTVSFTMTLPNGTSMPVDLIIVPNLPKSGPHGKFSKEDLTNIYQQMKAHPEQRDYLAKCVSPLQVSFVKDLPEKIKRAIRLTKYWAKTNKHKLPSYAIELLAIKTYEDFNRPEPGGITEKKIVNEIFTQLKDCKNMKIEWNTNYDLDDYSYEIKGKVNESATEQKKSSKSQNSVKLDTPTAKKLIKKISTVITENT
ncbi:2'-5'-oligoadenylate synthase 1A-like [Mytilus californianus]|uniref:2'-5'-oligoadenylate synthase 1A-like n=1 Tax=Mytilus californianus TaxID=6549 RepID=UPI002246C65B|nr:2'-5'-oligoadenylate synthase 1A-like [Mytilus californianus]